MSDAWQPLPPQPGVLECTCDDNSPVRDAACPIHGIAPATYAAGGPGITSTDAAQLTGDLRRQVYGQCRPGANRRACALGAPGCNVNHRRHASRHLWALVGATMAAHVDDQAPDPRLNVALAQVGAMAAIATLELDH